MVPAFSSSGNIVATLRSTFGFPTNHAGSGTGVFNYWPDNLFIKLLESKCATQQCRGKDTCPAPKKPLKLRLVKFYNFARSYCTGHGTFTPSAFAACNGKYGSRSSSRAIITR